MTARPAAYVSSCTSDPMGVFPTLGFEVCLFGRDLIAVIRSVCTGAFAVSAEWDGRPILGQVSGNSNFGEERRHAKAVNLSLTTRGGKLMNSRKTLGAAVAVSCVLAAPAQADPVDLSTWTQEGSGTWNVQPGNDSVIQTVNGNPTIFYSDFNSFGSQLSGTIQVNTTGDDDFIGFVLGFNPGDLTSATTDFLLIDWKQGNQGSFGCTASAGLAISSVSAGLGNNAGAWCHQGAGVTELARGTTLGNVGWADNALYTFDLAYTPTNVQVFVNGALQMNVNGAFSDGRFGFYNYSQAQVEYAGITTQVLPPPTGAVPEPSTWAMMMFGFGALGFGMRRRRQKVTVSYA